MVEAIDVLLVEDNALDVEMTMRALSRHNLANRVHTVRDGAEAIDFLFGTGAYEGRDTTQMPHVVFLDLKLPKLDGAEVLRCLREDERFRTLPVVIVTSSAEERDRARTYALGANSYVVKPIDFEAFATTLAQVGFYWLAINQPPRS